MTVVESVSRRARPTRAAADVPRPTRRSRGPALGVSSSALWWRWALAWGALDGPAGPGIALAML